MAELAPAHEELALATEQPAWYPTRLELLRRPLEFGIAIDPPNSHEIDDAVFAEALDDEDSIFRYKVHIADGGLLEGTPHLETAREKGWTIYHGNGATDSMLPLDVVSKLNLNRKVSEDGQPAITVSFIAGKGMPPEGFEVYKSRLICKAMTYKAYARRVRTHFHPNNPQTFPQEATVFAAARFLGGYRRVSDRYKAVQAARADRVVPFTDVHAYDINSLYMLSANIGMARLSQADGLPYIFRNHHIGQFDHPLGNMIKTLYPDSEMFARNNMAWYSRIPTLHQGIRQGVFGHATSPLRRSPDLFNHVNRSAVIDGKEPPFDEAFMDEFVRELADKMVLRLKLGSISLNGANDAA